MGIREDQKEQRRLDILAAALDLFVTKGYDATKITDIAKQASMSTGLMFHYFDSKEALYEELVKTGLAGTMQPAAKDFANAIDYFEQFTEILFAMLKKQPEIAKMFSLMAAAQRSGATPAHIKAIAKQVNVIQQFVPIIERGQKEGSIRKGSPLALSQAFWSAIQGITEEYAANPKMELPEAEWLVAIVRKGN